MSFGDFLRKIGVLKTGGQIWKGDAKDRPLDDPDQAQKMADLNREVDNATDNSSNDSGSNDW